MKQMSASQASWLKMRTPVNEGAFFLKLASAADHCSYKADRLRLRVKYFLRSSSVSSIGWLLAIGTSGQVVL